MYCDTVHACQESVEDEVKLRTGFNNRDKLDKNVMRRHGG